MGEIFTLPTPEDSDADTAWTILNEYDKYVARADILPQISSARRKDRFQIRGLSPGHVLLKFGLIPKKMESDSFGVVMNCIKKHEVDVEVVERTNAALSLNPHTPQKDTTDE